MHGFAQFVPLQSLAREAAEEAVDALVDADGPVEPAAADPRDAVSVQTDASSDLPVGARDAAMYMRTPLRQGLGLGVAGAGSGLRSGRRSAGSPWVPRDNRTDAWLLPRHRASGTASDGSGL